MYDLYLQLNPTSFKRCLKTVLFNATVMNIPIVYVLNRIMYWRGCDFGGYLFVRKKDLQIRIRTLCITNHMIYNEHSKGASSLGVKSSPLGSII